METDEDAGGVIGLLLRPSLGPSPSSPPSSSSSPLPIVRSGPGGVDLIAFDAVQFIHRALVLEDAAAAAAGGAAGRSAAGHHPGFARPVAEAAASLGRQLYTAGELAVGGAPL